MVTSTVDFSQMGSHFYTSYKYIFTHPYLYDLATVHCIYLHDYLLYDVTVFNVVQNVLRLNLLVFIVTNKHIWVMRNPTCVDVTVVLMGSWNK